MDNKKDDSPLTPEQISALFKEWTADYAAAKERDGHLKFGEIIHGPGGHVAPEQLTDDKEQDCDRER
ncbi:MAG: hypothetical protein JWO38_3317 [Gemmataceae bacterium]|nr:hypothetical protein [Gemmataceae bacterium]